MDRLLLQQGGEMAKRRKREESATDLPGVGPETTAPESTTGVSVVDEPPEPKKVAVEAKTLRCEMPYIQGVEGYATTRVDARLTGDEARKLKGILQGLEQRQTRLADGQLVRTAQHAIRWIVQNAG